MSDTDPRQPRAFIVICPNKCCGCSAPTFVGCYGLKADAEEAVGLTEGLILPFYGPPVEDWGT